MTIVALLIGFILIAAAIRNTQGALFSALGGDLPAYVVWAAALVAVGAVGFIPGLKTPSRWLLALVIVVLILNNYRAILSGFATVSQPTSMADGTSGPASAQAPAAPPAVARAGDGSSGLDSYGALIAPSPGASAGGYQAGQAFGSTITNLAGQLAGIFQGGGQ